MKNQIKDRTLIVALLVVGIIATLGVTELYTMVIVPAFAPPPTLDQRYHAAIEDAMVAKENEISSNLTPILENNSNLVWMGEGENSSVLMVTWTEYKSSYPVGENISTTWGYTWVTASPEIQNFFKNDASSNVTLRAAQLLGLPSNISDSYFVELWVSPQALFRPSPDSEINDTSAQLTFPSTATEDYKNWFNSNIIYSYYPMKYPWTRLGYTYDWGNTVSNIGLSEFLIKPNSTVTVKSVTPTVEYLKGIS